MPASLDEIISAHALKKLFDLQVIAHMTPTCRTRAATTRTGSLLSTNCFRFWRRRATASASINVTLSQEQVYPWFMLQITFCRINDACIVIVVDKNANLPYYYYF